MPNIFLRSDIEEKLDIHGSFLFLEEYSGYIEGTGLMTVNEGEWFFKEHIPSLGFMPGTIITEFFLQTAAVYLMNSFGLSEEKVLVKKISVNLHGSVSGATQLYSKVEIVNQKRGVADIRGYVRDATDKKIAVIEATYVIKSLMPKLG